LFQGLGLDVFFNTAEGTNWLNGFRSGGNPSVNQSGFKKILARFRTLKEKNLITSEDLTTDTATLTQKMASGNVGVFRRSLDTSLVNSAAASYVALPFFGESADESCLFTYPVFSIALTKKSAIDQTKFKATQTLLEAMFSKEAQNKLNTAGEGLISYNKDVSLSHSQVMDNIQDEISSGKYFIRAINSNSFAVFKKALTMLVMDNSSDDNIISYIDSHLYQTIDTTTIATSDKEAPYALDASLCSPAGSIVSNTLASYMKACGMVVDSKEIAASLYKGDYNMLDIKALLFSDQLYEGALTKDQLLSLVENAIYASTTFANGSSEPLMIYPVLGGFTAKVREDGQVLELFDSNGAKLKDGEKYSVVISSLTYQALGFLSYQSIGDFTVMEMDLPTAFAKAWVSNGKLSSAVSYWSL
jgi:hypothetical protein